MTFTSTFRRRDQTPKEDQKCVARSIIPKMYIEHTWSFKWHSKSEIFCSKSSNTFRSSISRDPFSTNSWAVFQSSSKFFIRREFPSSGMEFPLIDSDDDSWYWLCINFKVSYCFEHVDISSLILEWFRDALFDESSSTEFTSCNWWITLQSHSSI